jgi:hypothetical protein
VSLSLFMILGDKLQHLRFPLARGLVLAQLQLTDADAGVDLGRVASEVFRLLEVLLGLGESTGVNRDLGSLNILLEGAFLRDRSLGSNARSRKQGNESTPGTPRNGSDALVRAR